MRQINIGDLYDIFIGVVLIWGGTFLFLLLKGYLPRHPSPEKSKAAEAWRKNYGTVAHVIWPLLIAIGIYTIISHLLKK